LFGISQTTKKIKVIKANSFEQDTRISDAMRLIGAVELQHDSALMFCDSALIYPKTNSFEAYGNVRVNQGDTITITGDSLLYAGATKLADLRGNVTFNDGDLALVTDKLNYNLNTKVGTYTSGATITSIKNQNTLVSKIGTYNSNTKTLFFKDSVVLNNPDYTINSDTLVYNTTSEVTYFHGPTTIVSDQNSIYCEHGWYDTKNEESAFWQNAYIVTKEQTLSGDSIYYNRGFGYGEAFGDVMIDDTASKVNIKGDYAYHDESADSSVVIGHTLFSQYFETDSMYLHADTIITMTDSVTEKNEFYAYHNVLLYKKDIQAKCDSLVYDEGDSIMHLFKEPVIWSENNQLTGEYIYLKTANGNIDRLFIENDAFIISEVDSVNFNQIKGKQIMGWFKENELSNVLVEGNGETIYFIGKENEPVTDLNYSICSDITILLKDNDIELITFLNTPNANLKDIKEVPEVDKKLKGFKWEDQWRPYSIEDLYLP